ncbi:MAG: hypothetical protein KJ607_01275, partial [Bacteroidetes bacterium]|nr:hypothetical protein [Bacteroidota bacterium]
FLSFLFISLIFLTTCGDNGFFSDKISEGIIEYVITYIEDEKDNPLIALLPTTLAFKFKEDNSMQKIEGWMGIFIMAGINNVEQGTYSALLKIMNEKYCYQTTNDGEPFGFDEMPGMNIEITQEEKEIAGYKCKKARITFSDSTMQDFDIYYFDKIKLKNPNCHNPFREIPGVLMEYQMAFQGIKMTLKATKVEKIEVQDDEFTIPDGYIMVSRDEMDEKIKSLM